MIPRLVLAAGLTSLAWTVPAARVPQDIPPERLAAREWFRDAKLGMFVHWGVYSQLGQGEWVMENRALPVETYEWLASAFNPIAFDAREWVSLAKAAGARYLARTHNRRGHRVDRDRPDADGSDALAGRDRSRGRDGDGEVASAIGAAEF